MNVQQIIQSFLLLLNTNVYDDIFKALTIQGCFIWFWTGSLKYKRYPMECKNVAVITHLFIDRILKFFKKTFIFECKIKFHANISWWIRGRNVDICFYYGFWKVFFIKTTFVNDYQWTKHGFLENVYLKESGIILEIFEPVCYWNYWNAETGICIMELPIETMTQKYNVSSLW